MPNRTVTHELTKLQAYGTRQVTHIFCNWDLGADITRNIVYKSFQNR